MLGHALAIEHFADERLLESLGRLFAFRQFVEAIGQRLYRENFLVR
jgi:hypothetical protein